MRLEGYLFIPYRGQYRFSLLVHSDNGVHKYGGIAESFKCHDLFWDVRLRTRPTVHELVEPKSSPILNGWKDAIYTALNRVIDEVSISSNSRIKKAIADGYVEFVHVT